MKLNELLKRRELYTEDPESGNIYPKENTVFIIDGYLGEFTELYNDDKGRFYFTYGHYDDYKHIINDEDDIIVEKDSMVVDCSMRITTNHSDTFYLHGKYNKIYLGYDANETIIETLVSKFSASSIDYTYDKWKVSFQVNLRGVFDDHMFNLIECGLVTTEQFELWLRKHYE